MIFCILNEIKNLKNIVKTRHNAAKGIDIENKSGEHAPDPLACSSRKATLGGSP